jgi:hypothetical protein
MLGRNSRALMQNARPGGVQAVYIKQKEGCAPMLKETLTLFKVCLF